MEEKVEQFRAASGLSSTSAVQQVNTLLYCLDEEVDTVLLSTNITEEETVTQKFDEFFQLHRNVTFESARFNR